jgi:hypothetical protein
MVRGMALGVTRSCLNCATLPDWQDAECTEPTLRGLNENWRIFFRWLVTVILVRNSVMGFASGENVPCTITRTLKSHRYDSRYVDVFDRLVSPVE